MFTGIVEETGRIKEIKRGRASAVLTIEARKVLEDVKLGDSIAVNGEMCIRDRSSISPVWKTPSA